MLFHDPSRGSNHLGPFPSQQEGGNFAVAAATRGDPSWERKRPGIDDSAAVPFHGEALARDLQLERYGNWIVPGFTGFFALFLIGMNLIGQAPGQSFLLKSLSDIFQFIGEAIGCFFCVRIALRLGKVSADLQRTLKQQEAEQRPRNELLVLRTEAQNARRAYLAWVLLSLAIALYATGQVIWTSYDIRMPSSQVPFPGIYDIGFVVSYPFFLAGTLLLTRRSRAAVGRARLILDALAVLGAALALSWFFALRPAIAGLAQAPSAGAAFLSIYFPTGDLFLVAVGALLMFSPLSNREQQPVFLRLCLGLFFLGVTDSLLGYLSLSPSGFNTGTLQDILWPLSMQLVGLAAIEYPRTIAREQEQLARSSNAAFGPSSLLISGRTSQISMNAQAVTPFVLALFTCALLLTVVPNLGGKAILIQADLIALALFLVVVVRQSLTLIENNRLTMQMRGELVISRRELQVKRREVDEATQIAQEKRILEEGVAALQLVHAQVARGDFAARAPTNPGPLLPIAISLNLMLDRLRTLVQRAVVYEQLTQESRLLQEALGRLGQGLPAWPANQPTPRSTTELHPLFFGLLHLQRFQTGQWHRVKTLAESMRTQLYRARENVGSIAKINTSTAQVQMSVERGEQALELLEQQLQNLLTHTSTVLSRLEESPSQTGQPAGMGNQVQQQNWPQKSPYIPSNKWVPSGNGKLQEENRG
jgi:hypothetical protein